MPTLMVPFSTPGVGAQATGFAGAADAGIPIAATSMEALKPPTMRPAVTRPRLEEIDMQTLPVNSVRYLRLTSYSASGVTQTTYIGE